MTAAEIAEALGGAHRCGAWWRCLCPVHDSKSATLALRDGERKLIVKCFRGCDPRDVLAELCRRGLLGGRGRYRSTPGTPVRAHIRNGDARRIAGARRIWDAAQVARQSPVEHYLRSRGIQCSRSITCAGDPPVATPAGAACPRCWHG
jgi:putative DNA primase/helicase